MTERRRLFLDIETGPYPVWVWDLNSKSNAHISHKMIIKGIPWGIICVCWKWAGERTVHSSEWSRTTHNDLRPVQKIIEAMDQATEIIGHNGNRFDIKWIRGRAIFHRLPMNHTYPTLDTLVQSRSLFRFPSHRLDYLGEHLVGEKKLQTSIELWKSIIEDHSPWGMAKMVQYCKQDVRLLEKIYDRFAPYLKPITHIGDSPRECPECGQRARIRGYRTLSSGNVQVQLYCKDCPKWFRAPLGKLDKDTPFKRP